jgi:hypothetical protein
MCDCTPGSKRKLKKLSVNAGESKQRSTDSETWKRNNRSAREQSSEIVDKEQKMLPSGVQLHQKENRGALRQKANQISAQYRNKWKQRRESGQARVEHEGKRICEIDRSKLFAGENSEEPPDVHQAVDRHKWIEQDRGCSTCFLTAWYLSLDEACLVSVIGPCLYSTRASYLSLLGSVIESTAFSVCFLINGQASDTRASLTGDGFNQAELYLQSFSGGRL